MHNLIISHQHAATQLLSYTSGRTNVVTDFDLAGQTIEGIPWQSHIEIFSDTERN